MNSTASSSSFPKSDDDVVIVSAVRTAITKGKRGGFKDTFVEDLLAPVLKASIERAKVKPSALGDVVVGTVLGPGSQTANVIRIASFFAGIPDTVPCHILNRQCSSGLQACATVAAAIKAGYYEVGIGAGVESMSQAAMKWEGDINPKIFLNPSAKDCLLPMGITSENVAKDFGLTRQDQDAFAAESNKRAAAAQQSGKFKEQIIPVATKIKDPKTGAVKEVVIDKDDGIRPETTVESLSKLKPAFDKNGSTTAGNASQVSDGAASVVLASRRYAKANGLPILATFRGFAVAGVPPRVMGIGPVFAIPLALKKAGISADQVDVFEINEAFASQAAYSVKKLGLDPKKVNPNGGAIALGHPLGCTGARQIADLLPELRRRGGKLGVTSMCIGSGMGAAGVFELE